MQKVGLFRVKSPTFQGKNFFFRKKAPLVFFVKSERRFVFAKQRTMTLIFITKRTELH